MMKLLNVKEFRDFLSHRRKHVVFLMALIVCVVSQFGLYTDRMVSFEMSYRTVEEYELSPQVLGTLNMNNDNLRTNRTRGFLGARTETIMRYRPKMTKNGLQWYKRNATWGATASLGYRNYQSRKTAFSWIDYIYYFNSFANPKRHYFMENWLQDQPFPYHRIEPISPGTQQGCTTQACSSDSFLTVGSGLSRSYLRLPQAAPTIYGNILIIHDDSVELTNLEDQLQTILSNLPNDWNVVRLDCAGQKRRFKRKDKQPKVFRVIPNKLHREKSACIQSAAVIYRNGALEQLLEVLQQNDDLDCVLARRESFQQYCINMEFSKVNKAIAKDEPKRHVVDESWDFCPWCEASIPKMKQVLKENPIANPNTEARIDRIYYSNLEKSKLRRASAEFWMEKINYLPHKRINAKVGLPTDQCREDRNTTNRCRGIAGIIRTLTHILEHENTTGTTLVMEDDVVPKDGNLDRLLQSLKLVPDDWDLIRFDCWGMDEFYFAWINEFVIATHQYWKNWESCVQCWDEFCGGAYAMLWRGSSVEKLKDMWSARPFYDADCQISISPNVTSYCVQLGLFEHFYINSEWSDVSWLRD